jgi:23S rRNA pseudouridine955/2504/2580 synthase
VLNRSQVAKHIKIEESWAGLSAFEAVRRAFPEISARDVFRMARVGELQKNRENCHPLSPLGVGDVVTVLLSRPPRPTRTAPSRQNEPIETAAGPFQIVREDPYLLVVSKPAGCASHPALKHAGDTLIERVHAYLGVRPDDPFRPGLANRLDIETSGIVLVAKTRVARRRLGRHMQKGLVRKFYLTLVGGWPEPAAGEIRTPLVRRPDSRDRARLPLDHPKLHGRLQDATTRYQTVQRFAHPLRSSLLALELMTGRTHQIRRHLTEFGHPVAWDRRYGDVQFNEDLRSAGLLRRMFLHAHRVLIAHPVSDQPLDLRAPLPEDLSACLRALGASPLPFEPASSECD